MSVVEFDEVAFYSEDTKKTQGQDGYKKRKKITFKHVSETGITMNIVITGTEKEIDDLMAGTPSIQAKIAWKVKLSNTQTTLTEAMNANIFGEKKEKKEKKEGKKGKGVIDQMNDLDILVNNATTNP
jgi:hypothetical protein